ncbi:DNA polymerase III subunit gamma and tau [Micromonospora sp. LH3U1]|uniref:DNA polymerase III subunit gamma and tau n=1 Tax=Micromonospora sp. LH3U1 TaxID=3018339 RepID=UPI002349882B|nr:DNA polymerase III subunit gamma and tau [Micromonospora sp. LH3U1]WCN81331.1 DNA polymerase III subunit gamma and tau [Micromonospora sp. LH3U1]
MTLALYRKYRPRTFAEVIGQEHVTEPLSQALRSGRLNHAYLFSGPRGCGKTSSARILARSLNCEQGPTPEPCGKCESCRTLATDGAGSIDVIEIDAASHGGVDDARELRERAFFAPASSRFKIYVIDEAHMVSTQGFNALLKLVEEPPEYVKFIFATTEPEKVLGTIRSRTHHYPFRLIPPKVLRPYLEQLTQAEGVSVEPAVFPLVVRAGGGSARDSLSVLDQLMAGAGPEGVTYARAAALLGVTDAALIDEMCDALAAGDGAAAYATVDRVAEAGHDPRRFASDLLERLRDLIVLQQVPDAAAKGLIDGPADQIERMAAQASQLGPGTLSRCADIVHDGLVEMRGTTAPRLLLELICARMLLPGADDSTGGLLQRLERMERRLTLSGTDAPSAAAGSAPAAHPGVRPQHATPVPAAASPAPVNAPTSAPPWEVDPAASPTQHAAAPGSPASAALAGAPTSAARVSNAPTSGAPASQASAADSPIPASPGASTTAGSAPADRAAPVSPAPRRVVPPSAVLPDPATPAPPRPGAPAAALDAVAVRRVWPDVVGKVNRTNKRIAALMRDAVVRELDGDTLVLTVKSTVLAKMMADHAAVLTDALYEELGGRWQIRCDVAGERGGVSLSGTPRSQSAAPARPATPPPRQTCRPPRRIRRSRRPLPARRARRPRRRTRTRWRTLPGRGVRRPVRRRRPPLPARRARRPQRRTRTPRRAPLPGRGVRRPVRRPRSPLPARPPRRPPQRIRPALPARVRVAVPAWAGTDPVVTVQVGRAQRSPARRRMVTVQVGRAQRSPLRPRTTRTTGRRRPAPAVAPPLPRRRMTRTGRRPPARVARRPGTTQTPAPHRAAPARHPHRPARTAVARTAPARMAADPATQAVPVAPAQRPVAVSRACGATRHRRPGSRRQPVVPR